MLYLIIFALIVACALSVCVRVVLSHPISTVKYAVNDLYKYIKFKQWHNCKTGALIAYVGLFGKGKTLSAVHHIVSSYKRYNGKLVYDFDRNMWVKQVVHVISNVDLSIPYEKFESLAQIVHVADTAREKDKLNDTLTVTLVLGDEFSVQLNSRKFKDNIDPLFLNTLLTCRHHHISLIYTSQRFNHVDALLRQVTSAVITCNKTWRIMVHGQYDAYELENAADPTQVKPRRRFGWFIFDKDYSAYDTLACVGNLSKSCKEGDMLSEDQILALQQNQGVNMEAVSSPSRSYIRTQKKLRK